MLQCLAEVQPRMRPHLRVGVDLELDRVASADSNAFFNNAQVRRGRSERELGVRPTPPLLLTTRPTPTGFVP